MGKEREGEEVRERGKEGGKEGEGKDGEREKGREKVSLYLLSVVISLLSWPFKLYYDLLFDGVCVCVSVCSTLLFSPSPHSQLFLHVLPEDQSSWVTATTASRAVYLKIKKMVERYCSCVTQAGSYCCDVMPTACHGPSSGDCQSGHCTQ